MFFLEKKKKNQGGQNQKQGQRAGPEATSSSERFVTVYVPEAGRGEHTCAYVIPASHLARPRFAPLVAMEMDEDEYGAEFQNLIRQGGGDVIVVACRHRDFVEAMVLTAVEEAVEGRTADGASAPPPGAHGKRRDFASYFAQSSR